MNTNKIHLKRKIFVLLNLIIKILNLVIKSTQKNQIKMPKNKGRGGKSYRRGKNDNDTKRELVKKEEGSDYAQVLSMLGNGRLSCKSLSDGKTRLAHIRGRLKKKVWI
jgi:hypothetical protein